MKTPSKQVWSFFSFISLVESIKFLRDAEEASGFSNSTVIVEIDFNIVDGAGQLITNFVTDTQFSLQILSHGCWCAKLNRINQGNVNLGGKETVDEIDRICKEWHQARHCSKTCNEEDSDFRNSFYQVEYYSDFNATYCPDDDICLSESCQIDSYYSAFMKNILVEVRIGFFAWDIGDLGHSRSK